MNAFAATLKARARDWGVLGAVLVLVIVLSSTTSTFFTQGNLVNLLDQMTVAGILACGVGIAMIAGVLDLSVAAIAALSAVIGALAINAVGTPLGVLIAIVSGVALGAFNGLAISVIRINPLIATLATAILFRGLAVLITGGQIVSIQDPSLGTLSRPSFMLNITWASLIYVLVAVIAGFVLWRTVYGREIYAVGGNPAAARLSGIKVGWVQTSTLMISGGVAALAGVVMASRAISAQSSMGMGLEFTAIAAVVIGGVSLAGGQGAIWRAVVGVLLLQMISNGFNLLGLPTTFQQVMQGLLILIAVGLDALMRRRRA